MVQPPLTQPFPEPEFFVFWAKHLAMVWAAVYVAWVRRQGPDWTAYRTAVGWTLAWLVLVFGVNTALGSNYGYVNRKPTGTVLTYLGPWPVYVAVEAAIVLVGLVLITLPWAGWPRPARLR
jgi:hypothetical integral membrane protein (TIGR02206 family)